MRKHEGGQWLEGLRLLERKNRTEDKAEKQNKTLTEARRQKMERKTEQKTSKD